MTNRRRGLRRCAQDIARFPVHVSNRVRRPRGQTVKKGLQSSLWAPAIVRVLNGDTLLTGDPESKRRFNSPVQLLRPRVDVFVMRFSTWRCRGGGRNDFWGIRTRCTARHPQNFTLRVHFCQPSCGYSENYIPVTRVRRVSVAV